MHFTHEAPHYWLWRVGSACTGGMAQKDPEQQLVMSNISSSHDVITQRRLIYGEWKCGHPVGETS